MAKSIALPTILMLLVQCGSVLFGQGSLEDYERLERLRHETANKVVRNDVKVSWLADGLWYRVTTGPDSHEFVRVKFAEGNRVPAFDHERLAESLRQAGVSEARAERLVLSGLEFAADGTAFTFNAAGMSWQCDLATMTLSRAKAKSAAPRRPLGEMPKRSQRTGDSTSLMLHNQSKGDVQLWWLSTDGERVRYESVKAGATLERQTYAGHVWLVTDAANRPLAWIEARDNGNDIEVDGKEKPATKAKPAAADKSDDKPAPRSHGTSPDGRWHASIRDHNVHVEKLAPQATHTLTQDGKEGDAYGTLAWSPDSQTLAAVRTTEAKTRQIHLVESSPKDQLQPKLQSLDYAKPGDPVEQRHVALFDVKQMRHIPVQADLFANQWSLTDFAWTPDSREFTFLFNQRGHQRLRIVAVNAETGDARAVVEEQSATFIDYSQKTFLRRLDATGELIWASERDGWNHLFLYDVATGRVKNPITSGAWLVRGVERVDESRRQIWFRAGGIHPEQDPYHVHFARVNFDGSGLVLLTQGDGTHSVELSADSTHFIDTWSRVDLPPVRELRRAEDGKLVCELERVDWSALRQTGWEPPERFVAKGRDHQTDIHGIITRPTNFDPAKRYPVIESIYAGPHGAFVPKSFGAWQRVREMAELGFVIVQIDGMGTNWREKKFHNVCWKNLKDAGFPDRIAWMKAAAESRPWMDLARVGIYGGSAGGQNALAALLHHGDFYQAAVADCGCHDNRMDKIWWNEAWMGWPIDDSYADNSNVTHAGRLRGKLLLVVGELDHNVDPASTLQVTNALVKADKDFDLLLMPGTGHGAAESPYANRRRMDFFVRHLLGKEPRWKKNSSGE